MWDEYNRQYFNLKAVIFYTINDNPAHLSLTSFSKLVYMWHRRFLAHKHKYHQWRTRFIGTTKNEEAMKHRDGKFVFEMIKNINVVFRKPVKGKKKKKNEKAPKDSI
jgi:hypothetical protein